ncbi:MAG: ATP-binding protein [Myxococcota bacterium]|nr:ATP-binding protein [Myxococcota bacterium]
MENTLTLPALKRLVAAGESETLELKRSTGELRDVMRTLCGFANAAGGKVVVGVKPDGQIVGQQVREQTLHEIAACRERFEPPVDVAVERVRVGADREVLALAVGGTCEAVPCTYDGRPYERVGNTTRRMPQGRYETLLLERAHSRRRWENQVVDEITIRDIDRQEVLRIVEAGRSMGRLIGPVGRSLPDLLDRPGVRRKGQLLRAAVVLFGKTFLPDYPQCELRMARFRGRDKTEFLDQRHVRGPAFKLLEEAELFCQRHFPLPGRIESGKLQRVDRPLMPPDAMREILVNALIHRDYTIAGGAVSPAIFDDRVEVWSAGRYPEGITAEMLTRTHPSVQRNPVIAEVFYRAGLIEKWGRGTNRVAEMCRAAGIAPPSFDEVGGAAVVTFHVEVGRLGPRPESQPELRPESRPKSQPEFGATLAERVVALLRTGPLSKSELARRLGTKGVSGQLKITIASLLERRVIEFTIPEKKGSRFQKYRLVRPT